MGSRVIRASAAALLALGCGGEAGSERSQFVVVLREETAEEAFTRLLSISTLGAPGRAELEAARRQEAPEYPASELFLPGIREGTVLLFPEDRQSFTEILLERDGRQRTGGTYSIAQLGLQPLELPFFSVSVASDKAYLVSLRTLQILVWDTEQMSSRGVFSLGLQVAPGYGARTFAGLRQLDERLLLLTYSAEPEAVGPDLTITVIDVTSDEVISTELEPRCSGVRQSDPASSGDQYFATGAVQAARYLAEPESTAAPCVLRMRAGADAFDPGWQSSLTEAVGSRLWGSAGWLPGAGLLLQVAPEASAAAAGADWRASADANIWELWQAEPDGSRARRLRALPATNASAFVQRTEQGSYLVSVDDTRGERAYLDITNVERPSAGLSVPLRANVFRVR